MRICLLSSERSGSNLLRVMLNKHSQISAPPAPQCAHVLAPYLHFYEDFQHPQNMNRLIDDMLLLTRYHPQPWNHTFTSQEVYALVQRPTFWSVFDALYTLHARAEGKQHWFSKENTLFDYAFEILHELPEIKFLYLVRDGRDYACSMRSVPGGHFHPYFIARLWKLEQTACLRIYAQLKPQGLILMLRYEDLLRAPEETLESVMSFLGLSYEPEMLEYYHAESTQQFSQKSTYWKNLARPIMQNNYNKFTALMSRKDIRTFEAVAGTELQILRYTCSEKNVPSITGWQRRIFSLQEQLHRWRQKTVLLNEPGRQQRQKVIQQIHQRLITKK